MKRTFSIRIIGSLEDALLRLHDSLLGALLGKLLPGLLFVDLSGLFGLVALGLLFASATTAFPLGLFFWREFGFFLLWLDVDGPQVFGLQHLGVLVSLEYDRVYGIQWRAAYRNDAGRVPFAISLHK